jgi:hypothetical protein
MNFPDKYFTRFNFTHEQSLQYLENSRKDFAIAVKDDILDVKFNYSYTTLIKLGITLLAMQKVKVRSVPGHHVIVIEKLSEILQDPSISDMGNSMRSKRNTDMYAGGINVTEKECAEYLQFVGQVLKKTEEIIRSKA